VCVCVCTCVCVCVYVCVCGVCVCVCVCVRVCVCSLSYPARNAKCHCVLSSVAGPTLLRIATLSHKQYDFMNKIIEHKYVQ